LQCEREIGAIGERITETRREHQRIIDVAEKAKSDIRSLLMSHMALIDRPSSTPAFAYPTDAAAATPPPATPPPAAVTHLDVPGVVDESVSLPLNGTARVNVS
jgi:hypothetical protein